MCRLSKPLAFIITCKSVLHMLNRFVWFCIALFCVPLDGTWMWLPSNEPMLGLAMFFSCVMSSTVEPKSYEVDVMRSGGVLALYI